MLVGEELYWGCSGIGTSISANGLGSGPVIVFGSRRAEGDVARAADRGADPLLVRPLRAGRRLRRRLAEDDRRARGRRVRPQRLEDVHHERGLRRVDGRLREDRPEGRREGDVGVHRPDGHARRDDRDAPRQDGPALDRHVGVRAPGRSRPRREPARRGGRRLQDRDGDARLTRPGTAIGAVGVAQAAYEHSVDVREASASRSTCRSRCTRASTS